MPFVINGSTGINLGTQPLQGVLPDANAPSGSVIQVVSANVTGNFSTTSTTFVHATNHSLTITTASPNSKILLLCNTPVQMSQGSVTAQTAFRSSLDGYTENLGATALANYSDSNGGWKQVAPLQYLHSANQAEGTTITYRVYLRKNQGSDSVYMPDPWGLSYSFSITAMEISA